MISLMAKVLSSERIDLIILAVSVIYLLFQHYQEGLNWFRGPFLASFTNNWRLIDVWDRDTHMTFRKLHHKYGKIVRVAPNVLSFGDPAAIQDMYGLNKGYTKVCVANQGMTGV
jgi:hypothetical protein